eukprot:1139297-Pelagomonas_calceolata.AAC.2
MAQCLSGAQQCSHVCPNHAPRRLLENVQRCERATYLPCRKVEQPALCLPTWTEGRPQLAGVHTWLLVPMLRALEAHKDKDQLPV